MNKTGNILLRLSIEEKEKIQKLAKEESLTVSAYIRRRALQIN